MFLSPDGSFPSQGECLKHRHILSLPGWNILAYGNLEIKLSTSIVKDEDMKL